MTPTAPAPAIFYRVTEFFHGDALRFLALRVDAAGQHTGRVEGSAAREYHQEAVRDDERVGLPEWPNPWARLA
jgi:hypothetical protein